MICSPRDFCRCPGLMAGGTSESGGGLPAGGRLLFKYTRCVFQSQQEAAQASGSGEPPDGLKRKRPPSTANAYGHYGPAARSAALGRSSTETARGGRPPRYTSKWLREPQGPINRKEPLPGEHKQVAYHKFAIELMYKKCHLFGAAQTKKLHLQTGRNRA